MYVWLVWNEDRLEKEYKCSLVIGFRGLVDLRFCIRNDLIVKLYIKINLIKYFMDKLKSITKGTRSIVDF